MTTNELEAQLSALDEAISSGALTVKYQDRQVTYRSMEEMMRARSFILRQLNRGQAKKRITLCYDKGL